MNTETQSQRQILGARERQKLEREVDLCRRDMAGGLGTPAARGKEANSSPMPERMRKRLEGGLYNVQPDPGTYARARAAQKALSEGSPDSLSDGERLRLEKVVKDFSEWAPRHLMPKRMNGLRAKDEGFQESVKAAIREHSPEFRGRVEAYRNAIHQIDPDNEDAGNIEKFRPN